MTEPQVVFLRGVNLGGRNKVPQKALADRLGKALGVPVKHYLQSGNLVVGGGDAGALSEVTSRLIKEDAGLEILVVVRSASELRGIADACPWPREDPTKVHLAMWQGSHDAAGAKKLLAADWGGDELAFAGENAWLHYAGMSHTSKLLVPALDRALKVTATARNLRTIQKLADLAADLS